MVIPQYRMIIRLLWYRWFYKLELLVVLSITVFIVPSSQFHFPRCIAGCCAVFIYVFLQILCWSSKWCILDLLWFSDKRDLVKGLACKIWIWELGSQGQMIWEKWTIQDIIEELFMLYKAWLEFGMTHVNWIT
jgi:hypothetical protein